MANLIAPQQASINSSANLPGVKPDKKVQLGKDENAPHAKEFESKLEQGIANQAKAGASVQLTAQAKQASAEQAKLVLAEQGKQGSVQGKQVTAEQAKQALAEQAKQETLKKTIAAGVSSTPVSAAPTLVDGKVVSSPADQKSGANPKASDLSSESLLALKGNTQETQIKGEKPKSTSEKKLTAGDQSKIAAMSELQPQVLAQVQAQAASQTTQMSAPDLQQMQAELAASTSGSADFGQGVEVESLKVKNGVHGLEATPFVDTSADAAKRVPTAKMSTADYLNFRDMARPQVNGQTNQNRLDLGTSLRDSKKGKLEMLGARDSLAGTVPQAFNLNNHGRVVEAPVTQGSAGKTVLSHDALHQITQQVNLMSSAKQDGEIKIRLKPDHLGELQMVVRTSGAQVSIQIKAHDGESKKIIEDSLGALKDSLSRQNLILSHVEIVNQPTASAGQDQGMQMDLSQFRQNSGQDQTNSNQGQNTRQERLYEESLAPVNINAGRANRSAQNSSTQGLDLIA